MHNRNNCISKHFIYPIIYITVTTILLGVYALRGVYPFGNSSVLALDLNAQYIYYYEFFRDVFYNNGTILYSFSRTLGGEMIGTYAYYLASPFSYILLLFPKENITEAILVMILAKVGAAAVSFALYLRLSRKARSFETFLFSLMYALMSYMVVQTLNPMWLDGPIFFPLIILALERFIKSGRPDLYIITLALMFMANFYIGYMVGFFTFIYFIYYYFNYGDKSAWKNRTAKAYFSFFGASSLSVGLAMWLILPTYFALKMGKLSFTEPVYTPMQRLDIFDLFSKMLPLVYDSVNVHGFPFIYCGLFTVILLSLYFPFAYIEKKKKFSAALLLLLFTALFMVSTIDIALHGFQEPVWLNYRYSFVISFMLLILAYDSYATIQIFETKKLLRTFLYIFLAIIVIGRFQYEYIEVEKTLWFSYMLLFIYGLAIYILKNNDFKRVVAVDILVGIKIWIPHLVKSILVLVVVIELFLNTVVIIEGANQEVYYSDRDSYRNYFDRLYPHVEYISEKDKDFYRAETVIRRTVNDPMALGIYGVSHSSSVLNIKVIDLLYRLGLASREHWTRYKGTTPITDAILGIRYIISETKVNDLYEPLYTENGLTVYRNPYALPVAFCVKSNIKEMKLDSVDPFVNQNILLNAISGNKEKEYFKLLPIKDIIFENMTGVEQDGLVIYDQVDAGKNAHIEYILEPVGDHGIYMYLVSDYPRRVNIWVDYSYLDTFFDYESTCIMPLGSHPDKETLSLITTPIDGEYYLNHNMFYYLDTNLFLDTISILNEQNQTSVEKLTERSLQITTTAKAGEILFTTIPYNAGWQARINGKNVDTFMVLNSLLALELQEGEQVIDLEYYPQGYFIGLYVSIISFLLLSVIIFLERKKDKKDSTLHESK